MPNRHFDTYMAAQKQQTFNDTLHLQGLCQLNDFIVSDQADFLLKLTFSTEQNKVFADGHLSGKIWLECQRSLQAFSVTIDQDLHLRFVTDDRQMDAYDTGYEPYISQDGYIDLWEIVQQEILLNIPLIPKITLNDDCQDTKNGAYYRTDCQEKTDQNTSEKQTENPFAVLQQLKNNIKQTGDQ